MIDPDSTQAVAAPGRHRVKHWEDAEGYRTRPPYAPPASEYPPPAPEPRSPEAATATGPGPQPPATAAGPRPQPPATATGPQAQPPSATPATPPRSGPSPASGGGPLPGGGQGRLVYREEAMRRHVETRAAVRMPLVISGPSFLLLWIAVAVVLTAGAAFVALALGAGG
ncbi:hypothetical protein [Streptosporangium sp. NPDC002524]|uniref:hypothetical protein n=1 Tax=Streptosporangium sp. NPDC002524 TaxID=3154537 RepID=UPI00332F4F42